MSYATTATSIRPNINVEFFNYPADVLTYINTNYVVTGKRLSVEKTFSEDQLTRYYTTVWATEADHDDFLSDPVIVSYLDDLLLYNENNGIVVFR